MKAIVPGEVKGLDSCDLERSDQARRVLGPREGAHLDRVVDRRELLSSRRSRRKLRAGAAWCAAGGEHQRRDP
jgi:hypothetical protein